MTVETRASTVPPLSWVALPMIQFFVVTAAVASTKFMPVPRSIGWQDG